MRLLIIKPWGSLCHDISALDPANTVSDRSADALGIVFSERLTFSATIQRKWTSYLMLKPCVQQTALEDKDPELPSKMITWTTVFAIALKQELKYSRDMAGDIKLCCTAFTGTRNKMSWVLIRTLYFVDTV